MTVECTEIESVLAPLRRGKEVISIHDHAVCSALKWSGTYEPPIDQWLGDNRETRQSFFEHAKVAAFVAFMDDIPVLAGSHPWSMIIHQTSGAQHSYCYFVGRRVQLKPILEAEFLRIAHRWYETDLGPEMSIGLSPDPFPTLSQLTEYRAGLQKLGFDCNLRTTYNYLAEGVYPIDLTQEALDKACITSFPLEELVTDQKDFRYVKRAVLLVIAPSSR